MRYMFLSPLHIVSIILHHSHSHSVILSHHAACSFGLLLLLENECMHGCIKSYNFSQSPYYKRILDSFKSNKQIIGVTIIFNPPSSPLNGLDTFPCNLSYYDYNFITNSILLTCIRGINNKRCNCQYYLVTSVTL